MTRRGFLGALGLTGLGGCAVSRAEAEQRYPPIGRFVEVEGLRVHYVEKGAGVPVVLIHGASGNLRDMTFSLTDRLAEAGLRPIAFDRPGLGYSDRPAERGWDPAVQARVLRGAMRAIGVERAVVAGHSWGGAVAMAWALDAPETVIGAASLAGATYPWGGDAGFLYTIGANPILSPVARAVANAMVDEDDPTSVIRRIFSPNTPPAGYADYVGVGLALRPETFRNNAEDLDTLHRSVERMAPRYPSLSVPVLAIHGASDSTVWASVHSEPLAEDAPQGALELLEGVGHMPHHVAEAAVVAGLARLAEGAA
jgi:pimeloyl-ACP methyl ester carboxylesterase